LSSMVPAIISRHDILQKHIMSPALKAMNDIANEIGLTKVGEMVSDFYERGRRHPTLRSRLQPCGKARASDRIMLWH
jgi:hypothetical protein